MRKSYIFAAATLLVAGSVMSAQVEIDDDFMRTVEDTNKSLANSLATRDIKASTGEAKELEGMFAQIEAFYTAKGDAADAVALSKKSRELSGEIGKLAAVRDFDNATVKATDLSRACKACHNFYKKS